MTAPIITSVSVRFVPQGGAPSLAIHGSGFTGATSVLFDSTPAASFVVVSDTDISAVPSAPLISALDITVTTPGGSSAIGLQIGGKAAPQPALTPYVSWSGTAGRLPATPAQKLTTQGGNTLDDGSGNVAIRGGSLDGVTIGAGSPAQSINTATVMSSANANLTASKPWINQSGTISGSPGVPVDFNHILLNDQVDAGFNWVYGLRMIQNVKAPAVGLRSCLYAQTLVTGAGVNTANEAQYVGITGQVKTDAALGTALGGRSGAPIGEFWGGWIYANIVGGTYLNDIFGCEIDASVSMGASVGSKIGLLVNTAAWDAVRGSQLDAAVCVAIATGGGVRWRNGILFGRNQAPGTVNWPFDATSTMIGVVQPGSAGVGIDFMGVTFAGPAIKVPAPIAMGAMPAPAAVVEGAGQIYVALDGSLHYLNPNGTDTKLA